MEHLAFQTRVLPLADMKSEEAWVFDPGHARAGWAA